MLCADWKEKTFERGPPNKDNMIHIFQAHSLILKAVLPLTEKLPHILPVPQPLSPVKTKQKENHLYKKIDS